jgi:DUF3089 family protein
MGDAMIGPSAKHLLGLSTVVAALALVGCAPPPLVPPPVAPTRYETPTSWLCLPGRADACARDLTATEIHADGSRTIERFEPASAPLADCFYVYPTVDLSLIPRNHDDFSSIEPMAGVVHAQAARLRASCALYAPLYRQVTLGTYLQRAEWRERALGVAFADVEAAFAEYLAHHNRGRPIVLVGHSQGAEMVVRLLRRFFDGDPAMRARLLVAMPIGGDVEVPRGATTGATFANIPQCTSSAQTACVVAYRSYAAGSSVGADPSTPRAGDTTLCVNPADLDGNALRTFSGSYFPVNERSLAVARGIEGVTTPWVVFRGLYAGQCVEGDNGFRYLAVSLAGAKGDVRVNPFDFDRVPAHKVVGLHILDFQIPQGDLLEIVARRVAALSAAPAGGDR